MNVSEFRKKGGFISGDSYGLSVVFAAGTEDELVQEFRQAKEALLDWIARRGKSANLVMFTVTALHDVAAATIRDIVAEEKDLSRPLQARTVIVSLVSSGAQIGQWTWSRGEWKEG